MIDTEDHCGLNAQDAELVRLINEAIVLELNVSRLYAFFGELFPEDEEFWQVLSIEEEKHALLLKAGRAHFVPQNMFPREILPESVLPLIEQNRELGRIMRDYEISPPSRQEAFKLAIALEESVGEIHYQRAMAESARTSAMKVFQSLNKDDRDHADRIRRYMEERGIGQSP